MQLSVMKVFLYIVVFVIIFSLYTSLYSLYPKKFKGSVNPRDFNTPFENISFKTKDNITIKGWFIPNNKSKEIIIIGHGYPFDKGNVLGPTLFLHDHFNLLYFDFRSFGESEGKITTGSLKEVHDFNAAVEFAIEKGYKNIGAFGFSLSASTFLAANNRYVKAIVAEAPFADLNYIFQSMYRMFWIFKWPFIFLTDLYSRIIFKKSLHEIGPLNNINENNAKILLIHGKKDSQIEFRNSVLLHDKNPKTELWLIEDADHGQVHVVEKERYEKRIVGFFMDAFQ